jgi:hypothetical protein
MLALTGPSLIQATGRLLAGAKPRAIAEQAGGELRGAESIPARLDDGSPQASRSAPDGAFGAAEPQAGSLTVVESDTSQDSRPDAVVPAAPDVPDEGSQPSTDPGSPGVAPQPPAQVPDNTPTGPENVAVGDGGDPAPEVPVVDPDSGGAPNGGLELPGSGGPGNGNGGDSVGTGDGGGGDSSGPGNGNGNGNGGDSSGPGNGNGNGNGGDSSGPGNGNGNGNGGDSSGPGNGNGGGPPDESEPEGADSGL